MTWTVLDALDDRAAVKLIADILDESKAFPWGYACDKISRVAMASRLRKLALVVDMDKVTTTTKIEVLCPPSPQGSPT